MAEDQKDYQLSYRILMLAVAIAMLGWLIPYGILNYKLDQCDQSLQVRLEDLKTKIDDAKRAIERK